MKILFLFLGIVISTVCIAQEHTIKLSEEVELIKINDKLYIHKTLTDSETYGRFYSNGLIYIQNEEALIADTPIDTSHANLIINWLNEQNIVIKAVVVNHHHQDALGSLTAFHRSGIPSYGYTKTYDLSIKDGLIPPSHTFNDSLNISIGNTSATAYYFGEGHTADNIALWIPSEQTLFGGCMIKSLSSGKGNLEDANTKEWSSTVSQIKKKFPEIRFVIPGHGNYGSTELLDYTIQMFKE
ncbi:MAG: subclass B1 metallo-beta-lactamase [Balneolaceae bacterium]|nr:subclass B1 metallo-beta-lactamase [Balneolaceae bacterium]MBO6545079.1 subclass B1 metallo-beta-lactamase [Balneolaceae bacterium]MBO6646475.1 subclass B1 metallo-beta-lactamase [Balneolaceae bacterium]